MEASDAEAAHEILRFALFKEVLKRERRKKRKLNTGMAEGTDDESGEGDSDEEEEETQQSVRMSMPPTATASGTAVASALDGEALGEKDFDIDMDTEPSGTGAGAGIAPGRLTTFRERLAALWGDELVERDSVPLAELVTLVNQSLPPARRFGVNEAREAIKAMAAKEEAFFSEEDDTVYKLT